MDTPHDAPPRAALVSLALIALWVAAHPWAGICHDGVLYAVQAMRHVRPDALEGDLFFAKGSQDDFSLFGRLYGIAVSWVGLPAAAGLLWAFGQSLWFLAAVAWVRRCVPLTWVLPVAAVVFALPRYYGSDLVLRVSEPFLTARSIAEPLTMLALLLAVQGGRGWAYALLGLAATVHPLMALPGVLIVLVLHPAAIRWRRWIPLVLPGSVGLVVVSLIGAGVVSHVDDQWYALLQEWNPIVVFDVWRAADWWRMIFPVVVLLASARVAGGQWAAVWRAVALCAAVGLVLAVVAGQTRWHLGLQVQFWRFGWIATWLSPLAALTAALPPTSSRTCRIVLLGAVPAGVFTAFPAEQHGWLISFLYALVLAAAVTGRISDTPLARRLLVGFTLAVGSAAALSAIGIPLWAWSSWSQTMAHDAPPLRLVLAEQSGWMLLGILALGVRARLDRRAPALITAAAVVIGLALSLLAVDGRSREARALENLVRTGVPHWEPLLPKDAEMHWPGRVSYVWLVLNRRGYASPLHLSASVFAREPALMAASRLRSVRGVSYEGRLPGFRVPGGLDRIAHDPPTLEGLRSACSDPALDFVVLDGRLGKPIAGDFVDPVSGLPMQLHRCADYRLEGTTARPTIGGG